MYVSVLQRLNTERTQQTKCLGQNMIQFDMPA